MLKIFDFSSNLHINYFCLAFIAICFLLSVFIYSESESYILKIERIHCLQRYEMSKTYVCNTLVPVTDTEQEVNICEASDREDGRGFTTKNGVQGQTQQLFDDITNSSIIEFLNQENQCYYDIDTTSEIEIESIFEEIHRLSGGGDNTGTTNPISDVNVEDILKEAERLITKRAQLELEVPLSTTSQCSNKSNTIGHLNQKSLSAESTPREMRIGNDVDKLDNEVCWYFSLLYIN